MRGFIEKYKVIITVVVCALVFMTVVRQCEKEPTIRTVTETKTVIVHDTITKTIISEPKVVYVKKYVDVKGDTKIVYLEKQDTSATEAKEYKSTIKGTKASAEVTVLTTGDLLDISGIITYPELETTTTITKTKSKSGLFLYGSVPLNTNSINIEAGVIYQFKNTLMLGVGGQYDDYSKSGYLKATIGVKIF